MAANAKGNFLCRDWIKVILLMGRGFLFSPFRRGIGEFIIREAGRDPAMYAAIAGDTTDKGRTP